MSGVDYLETAKHHIAKANDSYSYEPIKTYSLAAIANVLIAIAEKMVSK